MTLFCKKNSLESFIKRSIAPSGNFVSPARMFKTWQRVRCSLRHSSAHKCLRLAVFDVLAKELSARQGAESLKFFGSGKESLYRIFKNIRRLSDKKVVAISAYTCPEIAAAAVCAGFKVFPVDILEGTLDLNGASVSDSQCGSFAAVVLSNLYGMVDKLALWAERQEAHDFFIIDDACQSFLSTDGSFYVGCRPNTIGVMSFGRGKAYSCLGGGAVFFSRKAEENEGLRQLRRLIEDEERVVCGSLRRNVTEVLGLMLSFSYWLLERPSLYGLTEYLPYSHLGETTFSKGVICREMALVSALAALAQDEFLDAIKSNRTTNALLWSKGISQAAYVQPILNRHSSLENGDVVPNRYPVLCASAQVRQEVVMQLSSAGLGASFSYDKVLADFAGLRPHLVSEKCDVARDVAHRLFTLPVHAYVRESDIEKGCRIINECG